MLLVLAAAGKEFNIVAAILGILLLLVCSVPLGFLIAFGLRKWHQRHPIEKVDNEKKPLGLE